ncbi:MAG: ABC transporter permease, partial [Acidobacteriia bacterium]|nr:ABC transporter permease [Terriglobia bacterium]
VLLNDLRYTVRLLRKSPVFTLAVVLTVALAVGANTAIFSVVNAVILRPLPYAQPDRLFWIAERNDKLHLPTFTASILNYLSWGERQQSFESMGTIGFASFNFSGRGEPEQFTGAPISPSLLPLLGLTPIAGRAFLPEEEKPGSTPVVMISEGLWKRRFGGDPSLIGQTLMLNGIARTVVGVGPLALHTLTSGDIFIPQTIDPAREIRLNHVIIAVGRLKPGVSQERAQAEMDAVATRVGEQYPEVRDWGIRLVSFYHWIVSDQLQTALLVLLASVACVLLIACANVANLLLSRAAARQKEIAVRVAMGASRSRLLRQLLVESLTLSTVGGALGLAGAVGAINLINTALPPNLLPVPRVELDRAVLAFAALVTVATGLLFGIAPAWHAAKADVNADLKQAARSAIGARSLLRNGLAGAELALATMLLIGAGLLMQSLLQLQRVRLGFAPDHLLTFQVAPPVAKYPLDSKAPLFYRELLESLRTLPGVQGAAISSGIPFGVGNYTTSPMTTVSQSIQPAGTAIPIDWRIVSPGFFRVMAVPLLRGRDFTDADASLAAPVMIISEETGRKFFGDADPVGRTIRRVADKKDFTIVGVVGDVKNQALNLDTPSLYYPSPTRVWPLMDVVVRTAGRPESAATGVRAKVHALDSELAISNVRPLEEWVAGSAAQPRLNAVLLGAFAFVALLIAAIGIYGVLAYSVTQRTREIGLRMALGAPRGRVLVLIVREGMTVGLIGIGAGLAGALALSRGLESLVFGIPVRDPLTFGAVAAVLTLTALAACSIPARRASRVDPMIALRCE